MVTPYIPLMREFPFSVNNPERNVFIRRSSGEVQKHGFIVAWLLNDLIRRSFRFVNEIGVEDIELSHREPLISCICENATTYLISLNNFRWWIIGTEEGNIEVELEVGRREAHTHSVFDYTCSTRTRYVRD